MAMSVGDKGRCFAAINVTPMADVMIVLLIIFMVTTPLLTSDRVELPAAGHAVTRKDADAALVLQLDAAGALSIDGGAPRPFAQALAEVVERAGADPGRPVWLKADREAAYADAATVLDACRRAGAEDVVLATRQQEVR